MEEKKTLVHLSRLACDGRIFLVHLTLFLLSETDLSSALVQMSVIRTLRPKVIS